MKNMFHESKEYAWLQLHFCLTLEILLIKCSSVLKYCIWYDSSPPGSLTTFHCWKPPGRKISFILLNSIPASCYWPVINVPEWWEKYVMSLNVFPGGYRIGWKHGENSSHKQHSTFWILPCSQDVAASVYTSFECANSQTLRTLDERYFVFCYIYNRTSPIALRFLSLQTSSVKTTAILTMDRPL